MTSVGWHLISKVDQGIDNSKERNANKVNDAYAWIATIVLRRIPSTIDSKAATGMAWDRVTIIC